MKLTFMHSLTSPWEKYLNSSSKAGSEIAQVPCFIHSYFQSVSFPVLAWSLVHSSFKSSMIGSILVSSKVAFLSQ